jgi:hypothetical protein
MDSKFFKGLLAAIIACMATLFSAGGGSIWYYVVMIVGVVATYFAQNAFIKPVSLFGTIDFTDIIKGILIAIGTTLTTFAASIITSTTIDFKVLLSLVGTAVLAYLTKNLFSNSRGNLAIEPK